MMRDKLITFREIANCHTRTKVTKVETKISLLEVSMFSCIIKQRL